MLTIERSPFWPKPTAHEEYWERHHCPHTFQYDRADDGPEVEAIRDILRTHTAYELHVEAV